MKAVDANLLDLLKKSTQFVVPIYQRVYSWEHAECQRLWADIVHAGSHDALGAHFTGSIVYVERDEGTRTSAEPDLIIDGQQRVTTVMLLLAALAERLDQAPEGGREPVEGFSPPKIRGLYLTNPYEDGDRFFKLVLSKTDREALKATVRQTPPPAGATSRVLSNYEFFKAKLSAPGIDLEQVCLGLKKLVVVDVKLTRGSDNPQLVFETMNSTGKRLSQADLIRNYVLMDLPPTQQTRLYEDYWSGMEQAFTGVHESRFDEFVRHYLTLKTGTIPRLGDIYDAFKSFAEHEDAAGTSRESLVEDLHHHARWFAAMALGRETEPQLGRHFRDLERLKATVVYPFLLRVYADYAGGTVTVEEFVRILVMVISYIFRRAVCQIPTNSLNKTFAGLGASIHPAEYVNSIAAKLQLMTTYTRFPTDQEFKEALLTGDLYHFKRAPYFLRKLENYGRKEEVSTADYSIEHILPQNENLSSEWRQELGPDWRSIQERYLHTLGNLTLTGYNPEYYDRPFRQKRDMKGGFRESPLHLNQGLGQLDAWGPDRIEERAARLADLSTAIWPRPRLNDVTLARYRSPFQGGTGFDWTLTHQILDELPAGRWTGYYHLAEAVGTSAQALANHLSKCAMCTNAYRVLTWDGHLAEGFAWPDPNDTRDPRVVLEAEGLQFTNDAADPEQKLVTEDLLALIDDD